MEKNMKVWIPVALLLVGAGVYWYISSNEPVTYKNPKWHDIGEDVSGNHDYAELIYYNPEKDVVHGWLMVQLAKPKYTPTELAELATNNRIKIIDQEYNQPVVLPYPNLTPVIRWFIP